MLNTLLNTNVQVKRRASLSSASRDVLNNPIYGAPTSGATWSTVYPSMPARLAFSRKEIEFAGTGERIVPSGIMYFGSAYTVLAEDRIITDDGIEYVVVGVVPAYFFNSAISHYEATIKLP